MIESNANVHSTNTIYTAGAMSTGIPAVDAMVTVHLEGNITPAAWFKTIVNRKLKAPKPHLLAITILADIAYWYRPTQVRDEYTGAIVRYKKKFKKDLLQRSYKQISEQFGCSTGQAKEAVRFLEELGVIQRVFRDEEIGGTTVSNIMYLGLNVDRLKELTYPSGEISTEGGGNLTGGGSEISSEGGRNFITPPPEIPQYTNSTPQTTASISAEIPSLSPKGAVRESEDTLDEKNKQFAHYADLAELEHIRRHGVGAGETDALCVTVYELIVKCLADMSCGKPREYKGVTVSPAEVDSLVKKVVNNDGTLQYFSESVMWKFIDARRNTQIKNERGYLQSMIWDHLQTYLLDDYDM